MTCDISNSTGRRRYATVAECLMILTIAIIWLDSGRAAAEPRIVTTIKPIHSLAAAVMGDIATPYLIIKGAASPHTYALKPSDAAALQSADAIFRVSDTLETFLNAALSRPAPGTVVITLAQVPGITTLPFRSGPAWAASHNANHDDSHGHKHNHGTNQKIEPIDPHIWLSPRNAVAIIKAVEAELLRLLPASGSIVKRNAAAAITRIDALQTDLDKQLTAVRSRPYLVYHDAFQYFEHAFEIPAQGSIALGDSRAPGARRVRDLQERIAKEKIACIFSEPQFPPKLTRTLVSATKARVAVLDPIGVSYKAGPDAYIEMMRANAASLSGCLGRRQ
jgi:zinc transport system substrate-binding protein